MTPMHPNAFRSFVALFFVLAAKTSPFLASTEDAEAFKGGYLKKGLTRFTEKTTAPVGQAASTMSPFVEFQTKPKGDVELEV